MSRKLAVIGFDSISLPFLETFVRRGVMPTVAALMEGGAVTQTWPCYPWETATNWACLATGASPAVHGCNMHMPPPGGPLDQVVSAFPAEYCKAEQLWTAAHRAGKRSVVFDWGQSYPLAFEDGLIHVGEDGRPNYAIYALQEDRAYTTDPAIPDGYHVTHVHPAPEGAGLAFDVPITPMGSMPGYHHGLPTQYREVSSLYARLERAGDSYGAVALYADRHAAEPLLRVRLGDFSQWAEHTFAVDGQPMRASVRAKLLRLSPDGRDLHLYLSQIYPSEGFVRPGCLSQPLLERCDPYVSQCSRQQVVTGNACDIETYFEEQEYMGNWYRQAADYLLRHEPWDLFMFKWHGPDRTNHLAMYMIDPEHAMYDPARADEGWSYWDRIMGLGDRIVRTAIDASGPGAAIALVSDHGGSTQYGAGHPDVAKPILRELGLLVDGPEGVDWSRTKAYGVGQTICLNVTGRYPHGIVEAGGAEYHALRGRIIEALLDARTEQGTHAYRAVLPIEDVGRMGVLASFGDIFCIEAPEHKPTKDAFYQRFPDESTRGTWDWPKLNSGGHSDDSYFILHGPGVVAGYRRARPTLITSVAPTLAAALGVPTPKDADGSVLWDFFG